MVLGHYGLALAMKRAAPRVSLGTLTGAAQLADLIWAALAGWLIPAFGWWVDRHPAAS